MAGRLWWLCLVVLTGCATLPPALPPGRVALVELPMAYGRQDLAEAQAQQTLLTLLAPYQPLVVKALGLSPPACHYALVFQITDYGHTPKAWRHGYIAFEVVSTLAITAAIAYQGSAAAHALATTYLAEESSEEWIEGYAGFHALDTVSRPVRLKAILLQLPSGTPLWQGSATGFSDTQLSRLYRTVTAAEEQQQLHQSLDEAAHGLVTQLIATHLLTGDGF